MIEMPRWATPRSAVPSLVDAGGVMRSPLNTAALRVNRPGSHYRIALTFPPFAPREGRVIVSRLIRAQREGLRIEYPLFEDQGASHATVVDGAGQAGLSLRVRGMFRGDLVREGFWFSIENARGQHFLHNSAAEVQAGQDGRATLALSEGLRAPFLDGAKVHLIRPMIEGIVEGDAREWELSVDHQTSISFTIEEAR